MELIKWANDEGCTMVLSFDEVDTLIEHILAVRKTRHEEPFENLDIDYSPILDEEAK